MLCVRKATMSPPPETDAASSLEVGRRLKSAVASSPLHFEPGESAVDVSMVVHFLLDEALIPGYEGGAAQASFKGVGEHANETQ